ncbi:MAG: AMP-binding protein, partial [Clostridia bacterium]|nr:AMP-binding protein [Clostridia bacterium]
LLSRKTEENAWLHTHAVELRSEDLSHCSEEEISSRLKKLAASPMTAYHSDLFTFRYIALPQGKTGLFLRLHRLIADQTAMHLMVKAIETAEKSSSRLPKDDQYFHIASGETATNSSDLCDIAAYTWGRMQQQTQRIFFDMHKHLAFASQLSVKNADPYLFFAAVCAYRYRLTGNAVQVFGMEFDRRKKEEANIFGTFTEELPIVVQIQPNTTLWELSEQIRTEAAFVSTAKNCNTPMLQEYMQLSQPMYDTLFSFCPTEQSESFIPVFSSYTKHGLCMHITKKESHTMVISVCHPKNVYSEGSSEALLNRFLTYTQSPDTKVCDLPMVTQHDIHLYNTFNHKSTNNKEAKSPCAVLKEAQEKEPDRVAVITEKETITLRELYQKSVSVSALLQEHKISRGNIVGVIMRKSVWLPAILFGILDSGAAFYLIDTDLPLPQREIAVAQVDFLFADSNLQIKNSFSPHQIPEANAPSFAHCLPSEVAYLIETSGIYSRAKTVCISSRSLSLRMQWMSDTFHLSERILQKEPLRTDACIWELLSPAYGATLVIPPEKIETSHEALARFMEAYQITAVSFLPHSLASFVSFMENDTSDLSSLKVFFLFGERVDAARVKKWRRLWRDARFINLYGPTECTMDAASYEISGKENIIPLGKPAVGTSIFIVDENHELLPPGEIGRIMIVGELVGMGYIQDYDGFTEFHGKPAFITEDIGKIDTDGLLYFIAPKKEWIASGSYMISLSKISAAALSVEGIVDAYSFVIDGLPALCYVASKQVQALKPKLRALLSPHEMPILLYQVPKMPHIRSGKADFLKLCKSIEPEIENTPASQRESFLYDAVQEAFPDLDDLSINDALSAKMLHGIEAVDLWNNLKDHGYYYHMDEIRTAKSLRALAQLPPHKNTTVILRKDSFDTAVLAFPYGGRETESLSETAKLFPKPCTFFAVDTYAISEDMPLTQIIANLVGLVRPYRHVYVLGCGLSTPLATLCAKDIPHLEKLILASPPPVKTTQRNHFQKYSDKKISKLLKKRSDGLFPIHFFSIYSFLSDAELSAFAMHHMTPFHRPLPLVIMTPIDGKKKKKTSPWLSLLGGEGTEIFVDAGHYFAETLPLTEAFSSVQPSPTPAKEETHVE